MYNSLKCINFSKYILNGINIVTIGLYMFHLYKIRPCTACYEQTSSIDSEMILQESIKTFSLHQISSFPSLVYLMCGI